MSRGAVQAKIHAGDKYDTMNVCIYVRALMKGYLYYYRSLKKEYDASLFVQFVAHRIIAATHVCPPDNVGQGGINPPSRLWIVRQEAGELGAGIV